MVEGVYAYLKSEGSLDYRACQIKYYTYTLSSLPDKYLVNVNVYLQLHKSKAKKTLALNDSFTTEKAAIKYGIDKGKEYIDKNVIAIDKTTVDETPTTKKTVKSGTGKKTSK